MQDKEKLIREVLLQELREDRTLSLLEMAEVLGVTKERVRQLLKERGLPTRRVTLRTCPICENKFPA